jgi:hypothetical protein
VSTFSLLQRRSINRDFLQWQGNGGGTHFAAFRDLRKKGVKCPDAAYLIVATVTSSGGANRRREGNQDEDSMKVRFNYPHVIVL